MSEQATSSSSTAAASVQAVPQFLTSGGRRLFGLCWQPATAAKGTLLYLPPMAEEMNRCRSHVAGTARAAAAQGWRCLLLDPYATGESEGDSEAADWTHWVDDTVALLGQLAAQQGPVVLWGARTGALLAAEAACRAPQHVRQLLFWQPVLDGALFLNQTLRLRIASQMLQDGAKETTDSLRRRLADGETLEVAGYPLPGRLAMALDSRKMSTLREGLRVPVSWLEVMSGAGGAAAPASRKLIDTWPAPVDLHTVACPMVWQVHDREDAPALVEGTLRLLARIAA